MAPVSRATVALFLILAGCADYSITKGAEDAAWDSGWAGDDSGGDWGGPEDTGDNDDGYGSEDENDYLKLAPAATDAYVFVVNSTRNTVTRISVPSLEVITAEVGVNPTSVETTSDYTLAVTFNTGSDTVSILDAATLAVTEVEVRENLNAMVMSPDGRWVICYHDSAVEDDGDDDGVQSFNEISVVNLETATHTPMVVGFNPREVKFTDDGGLGVVVSDAYLAAIDLTGNTPTVERIQISEDTVDPPEAEEVVLAPDGTYAFVRQYAASELLVVGLASLEVGSVDVGDNPTDLDLTVDGSQAVAVARGANQLWIYDVADPFAAPKVVDMPLGEVYGSVLMNPDGSNALLYSTQSGVADFAAWDLATDEISVYGLEKAVASASITPNGQTALIFHDKSGGEDEFENHYALTLIELDSMFPNPLVLPAEPAGYADADDGNTGYLIMDGELWLTVLDYVTGLHTDVALQSQPVHVGVLDETNVAYVNQEHDLGRLSFYDPATGLLSTLTGFELNAGIEH